MHMNTKYDTFEELDLDYGDLVEIPYALKTNDACVFIGVKDNADSTLNVYFFIRRNEIIALGWPHIGRVMIKCKDIT